MTWSRPRASTNALGLYKQDPPVCWQMNVFVTYVTMSSAYISGSRAIQLHEDGDAAFIPASRSSVQEEFAYLTLAPNTDLGTICFKRCFGLRLADFVKSSSKIRRQSRFSVHKIGLDCTSVSLATPFQTRSTVFSLGGPRRL